MPTEIKEDDAINQILTILQKQTKFTQQKYLEFLKQSSQPRTYYFSQIPTALRGCRVRDEDLSHLTMLTAKSVRITSPFASHDSEGYTTNYRLLENDISKLIEKIEKLINSDNVSATQQVSPPERPSIVDQIGSQQPGPSPVPDNNDFCRRLFAFLGGA